MILPTKHLQFSNSYLGFGTKILGFLIVPTTISSLWDKLKREESPISFGHFILSLDFLYAINAIDYQNGLIVKKDD